MVMRRERHSSKEDALNAINGVADIIERRGNQDQSYWLIDDDSQICEFHYWERLGEKERYEVILVPFGFFGSRGYCEAERVRLVCGTFLKCRWFLP